MKFYYWYNIEADSFLGVRFPFSEGQTADAASANPNRTR